MTEIIDQQRVAGSRLTFTEEQDERRSTLRSFFAERAPESAVRTTMATGEGFDSGLWGMLSEQLGVPGWAFPEAYGGSGFSFVELGIVLDEAGRAPLNTAMTAFVNSIGGGTAATRFSEISSGSARLAFRASRPSITRCRSGMFPRPPRSRSMANDMRLCRESSEEAPCDCA